MCNKITKTDWSNYIVNIIGNIIEMGNMTKKEWKLV